MFLGFSMPSLFLALYVFIYRCNFCCINILLMSSLITSVKQLRKKSLLKNCYWKKIAIELRHEMWDTWCYIEGFHCVVVVLRICNPLKKPWSRSIYLYFFFHLYFRACPPKTGHSSLIFQPLFLFIFPLMRRLEEQRSVPNSPGVTDWWYLKH